MRQPPRSASDATAAPSGTARASRQRPKPSSSSGSTSTPVSTIWFWPAMPRSTSPAAVHTGMSSERASSRSRSRSWACACSVRPVVSNWMPASLRSRVGRLGEPALRGQREPQQAAARHLRSPRQPVEHEAVAALAVAQPVGDARDGGGGAADALGHLGVGQPRSTRRAAARRWPCAWISASVQRSRRNAARSSSLRRSPSARSSSSTESSRQSGRPPEGSSSRVPC